MADQYVETPTVNERFLIMRKYKCLVLFFLLQFILCRNVFADELPATESNIVEKKESIVFPKNAIFFKDPKLERVIRELIEKPLGILTKDDVREIKRLDISHKEIEFLDGVEYLENLIWFYANDNKIKDVTPLSKLNKLDYINLSNNFVQDVSPLFVLPEDTDIDIWDVPNRQELVEMHDKLKEIINAITTADMTDYQKELAIHDYIVIHTKYDSVTHDSGYKKYGDRVGSSWSVIMKNVGVCQGYAEGFKALMDYAGIECITVGGTAGDVYNSEGGGHAWNIVKIDGTYYHVDTTWDDPGNFDHEANNLHHTYFNMTPSEMLIDHKWDIAKYPHGLDQIDTKDATPRKIKKGYLHNGWIYTNAHQVLMMIRYDGSLHYALTKEPVADFIIYENKIYYTNADNNLLYMINLDGTEIRKITNISVNSKFYGIDNKIIYYSYSDFKIHEINLGNYKDSIVGQDVAGGMVCDGKWLYYINYTSDEGYGKSNIYRINVDGTGRTKVSKDKAYNLYIMENCGKPCEYIYYLNPEDNYALYRSKTDGSGNSKLITNSVNRDSCFNIEGFGDYIYFLDADEKDYYRINMDGTDNHALFYAKFTKDAAWKYRNIYSFITNDQSDTEQQINKPEPPVPDIMPGTYDRIQRVQLSSATPDVDIYYTLDGSIPTRYAYLYTAFIYVGPGTTQINAISVTRNKICSEVSKSTYTINEKTYNINEDYIRIIWASPPSGLTAGVPVDITLQFEYNLISLEHAKVEIGFNDGSDPDIVRYEDSLDLKKGKNGITVIIRSTPMDWSQSGKTFNAYIRMLDLYSDPGIEQRYINQQLQPDQIPVISSDYFRLSLK